MIILKKKILIQQYIQITGIEHLINIKVKQVKIVYYIINMLYKDTMLDFIPEYYEDDHMNWLK